MTPSSKVPNNIAAQLQFLSRERLNSEGNARVRDHLAGTSDWPMFLTMACKMFSLQFVAAHLARLYPAGGPGYDAAPVRAEVKAFAFAAFWVANRQAAFHRSVIAPLSVNQFYIEGSTLSARCCGRLGVRYARDVGVLVEPERFAEVVGVALAKGDRLFEFWNTSRDVKEGRELRAALWYMKLASMLSSDFVMIEFHREFDPDIRLFSTLEVLSSFIEQPAQGMVTRTLPYLAALLYLAHHRTRHDCLQLQWLADLEAIATHEWVEMAGCLAYTERRGMRPTLEANLPLRDQACDWHPKSAISLFSNASALLDRCLTTLVNGQKADLELRSRQTLLDVPYAWLLETFMRRKVFFGRLARRFRPRYQRYRALLLPESRQWLYYVTRTGGGMLRRLPMALG